MYTITFHSDLNNPNGNESEAVKIPARKLDNYDRAQVNAALSNVIFAYTILDQVREVVIMPRFEYVADPETMRILEPIFFPYTSKDFILTVHCPVAMLNEFCDMVLILDPLNMTVEMSYKLNQERLLTLWHANGCPVEWYANEPVGDIIVININDPDLNSEY